MIACQLKPQPGRPEWDRWMKVATEATAELLAIAAVRSVTGDDIVSRVYKGSRPFLQEAFYGKCAFCEADIVNNQPGDVEHYRPKCGVLDEAGKPVAGHNGYYWLAYDWRNLLPSCADCNRGRYGSDGTYFGKAEFFPVDGKRATKPGEEADEQAMLLHPGVDNPNDHLLFDPKTGVIAGMTERGKITVKLLGLNREKLPEARKRVYSSVRASIVELASALLLNEQRADELLAEIADHRRGKTPYALAARHACDELLKKLARANPAGP
ncbi:MAG TPA: hypothetical protein VHD62_06380 [Opitutaceae bacterium]|nr:hypothetical protein [Opitutaceae bacterium]